MRSTIIKKLPFKIFIAGLTCMFGLALLTTNSCKHDGPPADQLEEICFTGQVLPIFSTSCGIAGCHDAITAESGYVFTDYSSIMKSITPGNAEKSKAYSAITSTLGLMPPDNPLPINKRTLIRLWIEQGAKETTCVNDTTGTPGTKSGTTWACYDRDIEPIFANSCAVSKCHDAASHEEGINLSSYAKALSHISPGNPTSSKIYNAITSSLNSENFMPQKPYSALSKAAIDTIYSWIKRGGLNEKCSSMCDTTGSITYTGHIKPILDIACVSCHGANSPSGGIKLLTAIDVQSESQSGKLLAAVQRKGSIVMPPAYALDACQVREIELWMNQGYH